MTSTPRTTSDFNQVLVLHNRGGAWHGLLAEIDPVKGTRVLETVSFEGQQDGDIQAWIDAGADYVSMRAMALRGMGDGLGSAQAHIDALSTYWNEVGELSREN